jgi:Xaa-Pro aminopeptidase
MVFTVEPGLYRAGLGGIRLEDDVVVRDGEPEILSTLPLELVEL